MDKGKAFPVLDHGYVKFIDSMGTDETIIEAARMSTKKSFISWDSYAECASCGEVKLHDGGGLYGNPDCKDHKLVVKPDGDQGLLEYLWKNSHATPFEMCELCIEVQAPIFVFREWHRHRTQSYNEMSARYTVMPDLHYLPDEDRIQKQDVKNKQGSGDAFSAKEAGEILEGLDDDQHRVYTRYKLDVGRGVAKEIARINCPVSRYSKMRAKTDLRNWLAFLNLRMRPNAMWEIRQYANVVGDIIKELWPRTWELFEEHTLSSMTLSASEVRVLKAFFNKGGGSSQDLFELADRQLAPKNVRSFLAKMRDTK